MYDCILVFKPCTNSSTADPEFQLVVPCLLLQDCYRLPQAMPCRVLILISWGILYTSKLGCTMTVHDVLRYLSMGNKIQKGRPRVEHEIDRIQKSLLGTTCKCWHWCYTCKMTRGICVSTLDFVTCAVYKFMSKITSKFRHILLIWTKIILWMTWQRVPETGTLFVACLGAGAGRLAIVFVFTKFPMFTWFLGHFGHCFLRVHCNNSPFWQGHCSLNQDKNKVYNLVQIDKEQSNRNYSDSNMD
jgi:hypothetical protein